MTVRMIFDKRCALYDILVKSTAALNKFKFHRILLPTYFSEIDNRIFDLPFLFILSEKPKS
jgi:hypothetical protein